MNRAFEIVAILFCFELAIFLVIVPWSNLWETNVLFAYMPTIRPFILHVLVRTGITALGLLNFLIGVSEVRRFLHRRQG